MKGVRGLQVRLTFDPAVLKYKSVERGPALHQAMVAGDSDPEADPGKAAVGFICDLKPDGKEFDTIDDDGEVLKVVFTIKPDAPAGATSPVTLDNFRVIDAGSPPFDLPAAAENGEVTVAGAKTAIPWKWILAGLGGLLLLMLLYALWPRRRRRDDEHRRPRRRRDEEDDRPQRRPVAAPVPPYAPPPAVKVRRPKCRTLNDEMAKFCNQCGAAL